MHTGTQILHKILEILPANSGDVASRKYDRYILSPENMKCLKGIGRIKNRRVGSLYKRAEAMPFAFVFIKDEYPLRICHTTLRAAINYFN